MKTVAFAHLLLGLAALAGPAMAAPPPGFDGLTRSIQRVKDATGHHSGTAVAVVKDGRVVYEGYFGFADIGARVPADRDTAFYIASTTKPFLALRTLLAEDAGTLDSGLSLQAMFPDMRFGIDANAVTMRDLLVHRSGIDNTPLVWATAFSGLHDAASRRALVAQSSPNEKAPHGTFEYTNVGYNVLSVWLDQRYGLPWQDQLQASVFAPLGMTHTTGYVSRAEAAGWTLAKPYSFVAARRDTPLYLRKTDATMQAAGGLLSTAPDLARFLVAQLGAGRVDGQQRLPASVIRKSHGVQATTDGRYLDFARDGYAWGWYAGPYKGRRMLHHFGSFAGFNAHLSFVPEARVGLVVLNNEDVVSARLTSLIADFAYGLVLGEDGIEAKATARFDELIASVNQLEQAAARHRETIDGRAWRLSLPRAAYVGTYSNALLGDIAVGLGEDSRLTFRWGQLRATATGYDEADTVRVELVPNSGEVASFTVERGAVWALRLDGMVFRRNGDGGNQARLRRAKAEGAER